MQNRRHFWAGAAILTAALSLIDSRPLAGWQLPLPTPRTLSFTTDEGTWMSVDVSPDGRTLLFDLLGDLYTLPITGGAAVRITEGQSFDAMPSFSPDGRQIAFVSDRSGALSLWVAAADGSNPRRISRTEGYWVHYASPVWTPDGDAILVSRTNGPRATGLTSRGPSPYELYLYSLRGGSGEQLPAGAGGEGPGAAGGRLGATYTGPHELWYSSTGAGAQLFTLDLRTGRSIRRTTGGGMRPTVSPDGRWLVYGTRRGAANALRLRDLTTGDERWLVRDGQRDMSTAWSVSDLLPGMAFTPDGQALIASSGGKLWRIAIPSGTATPIPFTAVVNRPIGASSQSRYALNDSTLTVRQIRAPRIAPDGRRVAFVALDRVWVAELPADRRPGVTSTVTNARRLTSFEETEAGPTWSPDGRSIVFVTWNDSTGGHVYRVPAAGGPPSRLSTAAAFYEKPVYTPDGSRIILAHASRAERFEQDEGGFADPSGFHTDLGWMPADGGPITFIRRLDHLARLAPPYHGVPHFGPDPDRVLLHDSREGGLVSMRADGSDATVLFKATARPWNARGEEPADDLVLSPSGSHVAILGMQDAWVAMLPRSGVAPAITLIGGGSGDVPVRRLSTVGATFVGWSPDGRTLHYSLGASLFLHDVVAADSLARLALERGGTAPAVAPARVDLVITLPKDRPDGAVVLRGARVITMRGTEVIANADLVVVRNRIAAVGPRGRVNIPVGAQVIDVRGKTIIPGYVDTHAHLGALGWGVHRTEPWQYYVNLAHGVTTTRDPQTMTTDVLDYSDRVETGDILGPRIFTTARAVFAADEARSLEDARRILRRYSEFYQTGTIKLYAVGVRERRQWFVQAATELGLSPTSEGDANFMLNLTHLMDGYAGLEHNFPVFPIQQDVIRLVVESGATYTPVLNASYGGPSLLEYFTSRFDLRAEPRLQRFWPAATMESRTASSQWRPEAYYGFLPAARDAARIAAAGGRVAVGSHGNAQGIGYHLELWGLALGGMPVHEVLRAATAVGAQAIGHLEQLGSIEPGKLADLQVLDADPLANIRNTLSVSMVMRNGRLYDALTLDEVWPRRRPLPTTQWWMAAERQQ